MRNSGSLRGASFGELGGGFPDWEGVEEWVLTGVATCSGVPMCLGRSGAGDGS